MYILKKKGYQNSPRTGLGLLPAELGHLLSITYSLNHSWKKAAIKHSVFPSFLSST